MLIYMYIYQQHEPLRDTQKFQYISIYTYFSFAYNGFLLFP